MITPTIGGMLTAVADAFSATATEVKTGQDVVDAFYGGALIGGAAGIWRSNHVIKNTLGDAAYQRVKQARIGGLV